MPVLLHEVQEAYGGWNRNRVRTIGEIKMNELTHLSLFSGIGGLDLAAEAAGFRTVGQCEWADYQTKVLEKHWPDVPRWRDIRTLTGDDFYAKTGIESPTVVSGGFPCQPHSLIGKRKASNDDRDLWPELFRVFCETNARWLVAENVGGLLSSEYGRFFGRVLRDLANVGCNAGWMCFPAHAVGAPFWGERIAIIAQANSVGQQRSKHGMPPLSKWWGRSITVCAARPRYWEYNVSKPCICGKDDGFPGTLDRLKCLGNAVVPQQFYPFFKYIAEIERNSDEK